MTALFDIFRVESGGVRWMECVTSLEDAKTRVQQIAAGAAGEYIIVDQRTGNRLFLKGDGSNSDGGSADSLSFGRGN